MALLAVLAGHGRSQSFAAAGAPALLQVAQIRKLTRDQAARKYPIHLKGVITYHAPGYKVTFFQDPSGGIFIFDLPNPDVSAGSLVEITGRTTPGEFAPSIEHAAIQVDGRAPLPTATRKALGELMAGKEDSQWVEIQGIVHSVTIEEHMPPDMRAGPPQLVLEITSGNNSLKARIHQFRTGVDYTSLVDSAVTVRGVCGTLFNTRRQFAGVQLFVPSIDQLTVDQAPAADPYSSPVVAIGSLLQFDPDRAFGRRTHIRGIVTYRSSRSVFIQDDSGGVQVEKGQPVAAEPGDLVDAAGFPSAGSVSPILTHGGIRKIGKGRMPAPRVLTRSDFSSELRDSELVQITGRLLGQSASGNYRSLAMDLDGISFTAGLEEKAGVELAGSLRDGSQLRLTGIWSAQADHDGGTVIHELLLRSAADIMVIRAAPWINGPRFFLLLFALSGVILLTLLWVAILRRHVQEKTETLRAVLESTEDGILAVTSQGRVIARNQKFAEMWRMPEDLARTSDDSRLLQFVTRQMKDPDSFLDLVKKLYRESDVKSLDTLELADGRILERYSEPQRVKGKSVGRVWGFRDVTEHKGAEQHLRALSAAVEQSPVSIVITDLDGKIKYVNPTFTQVSGYSLEEVLGRSPSILKSGETPQQDYKKLWETIKSGASWTGTFHNRKKNGDLFWEAATICAIRDAQGAPNGYLAVKEDITQRKLATEALQESERRYRSLFEHMLEGFAYCRMEYQDGVAVDISYLAVNSAFEAITGLKDVLGKRASEAVPGIWKANPGLLEVYARVAQTGKPEKVETYVDAMQMWFSLSIYSPEQGCFISVFENIGERKRAESALRRSETKFRTLYDSTSDAVMLLDETGFFDCNPAALAQFGCASHKELRSLHPADISPPKQPCGGDSLALANQHVVGAFKYGVEHYEWIHKRLDTGTTFAAEVLLNSIELDGKAVIQTVVRDITERREAEIALRDSELKHRILLQHIPQAIFYKDRELVYVSCNDLYAGGLGIRADSIAGKTDFDFYSRELAEKYRSDDRRIMELGRTVELEEEHVAKGKPYTISTLKTPVINEQGEVIGILGVFTDITERKRSEEALRNSERQLRLAQKLESIGQLAAGVAHEINTPIQYVGDNAKFLEEAFRDLSRFVLQQREIAGALRRSGEPDLAATLDQMLEEVDVDYLLEETPKAIGQLLEGVEHVARIVRAMKEFSHPGPVEKVPLDINRAVESTVLVSRNEWKYVAELTTDFDPELPPVPCVAGEFNQVVLNLIVNAAHAIADTVKSAGGRGAIKITTRRRGNSAEVRVSDTGGGIPEAIQAKVFDPFFTTKEVGKGTGQGLSIAHAVIVQKHQGTLRFETEPGAGTTFILQLPLEGQFASETSSVCG